MKYSRFRYIFGSGTHYKPSKFLNFGEENQFWNQIFTNIFFWYQIFSIPIPVLFPGAKFFRYRFRDFFRYQIFPIPVPRLFPVPNFSDTGTDTTKKNEKFPVPVRHTLLCALDHDHDYHDDHDYNDDHDHHDHHDR